MSRHNLHNYHDMGSYELINSSSTVGAKNSNQHLAMLSDDDDCASNRSKARKTTEDDDHSSLGRYKGRAIVGQGQSDDRRRARDIWPDPNPPRRRSGPSAYHVPAGNAQSHSTSSLPSFCTGSDSSLTSQMTRGNANVASESCLIKGQRSAHQMYARPVTDLYTFTPQHNRSSVHAASPPHLPPFSTIAEVADHRAENARAL